MNKIVNIAIVGLGQVGIYLYNELRLKKKKQRLKQEKKLILLLYLPKIEIKRGNIRLIKKSFIQIPLKS